MSNNLNVNINGTIINNEIDCMWCNGKMHLSQSVLGSGLNTLAYFCNNCGSMLFTCKTYNKKIKSFEVGNYEFEDM